MFDIKSKGMSNAIKTPSISRASRGQNGRNETTRLTELTYVYLSFEHEVLRRIAPRRVLLHLCCCFQGFFYRSGLSSKKDVLCFDATRYTVVLQVLSHN